MYRSPSGSNDAVVELPLPLANSVLALVAP